MVCFGFHTMMNSGALLSPFYHARKAVSITAQKKEVQPLGRTLLSVRDSILCHSMKIVNITLSALYSHDES